LTTVAVHSKLGKSCVVRYGDERPQFETQAGMTSVINYVGRLIKDPLNVLKSSVKERSYP
jgi:hypothetical protein